jgi:hypothetical protein
LTTVLYTSNRVVRALIVPSISSGGQMKLLENVGLVFKTRFASNRYESEELDDLILLNFKNEAWWKKFDRGIVVA